MILWDDYPINCIYLTFELFMQEVYYLFRHQYDRKVYKHILI